MIHDGRGSVSEVCVCVRAYLWCLCVHMYVCVCACLFVGRQRRHGQISEETSKPPF